MSPHPNTIYRRTTCDNFSPQSLLQSTIYNTGMNIRFFSFLFTVCPRLDTTRGQGLGLFCPASSPQRSEWMGKFTSFCTEGALPLLIWATSFSVLKIPQGQRSYRLSNPPPLLDEVPGEDVIAHRLDQAVGASSALVLPMPAVYVRPAFPAAGAVFQDAALGDQGGTRGIWW